MDNFPGNFASLLANFGSFSILRLIIDYLSLNMPNKPETSVLHPLLSEKTAFPVAILPSPIPPLVFCPKIRPFTFPYTPPRI